MRAITKYKIILVLLSLAFSNKAKADHIIGSDISYIAEDTSGVYKIVFNFYRDCNGCYVLGQSPKCGTNENCASSSTAPTALKIVGLKTNSSTNLGTITMTRSSIVDITTTCNSSKSRCAQPCNGSFPYGIEKHTFEGTVDLRNAMSNGYCDFEISALLYVRNVGITTGQSQQSFYTSCEINACQAPGNSSPSLSNDPVAILCCNQPYSFNNGAVDTTDFDSISYSFAPAYRGQNQLCSYNSTRSYLDPISTYYPGSLTYPYANPNASPPIGTYLDAQTGDIIFTPVNCSEIAVVVIKMIEWRKDSTGTYKQIGVTRRDMQFIVMTCPDNNPPTINGPFSYNVCEGSQLCFNVTTNDVVYVPPPPAVAPDPDTVKVTWNRGIPGASFTVINPTARLQTGQFCWTPQIGQASDLPYSFTVTARDNACPLNAVTVRSFRVRVKHKAQADRYIDTLPCGLYAIESDPVEGFRGTPSYRWQILDSNRNLVVNKKVAKFGSTGNFLSVKQKDTIQFRRGGFYIIQHTVNNAPLNCPSTYFDTLIVPPLLEANLTLAEDTFVCANENLRLEPYVSNATAPISYQWSSMGVTDDGNFLNNSISFPADTLTYFEISIPHPQYDTAISLIITDGTGCTSEDTVQVFLKANPKAVLPPDLRLCWYDSTLLIPNLDTAFWVDRESGDTLVQGDTLFKEWFFDGSALAFSTDSQVTIHKRGEYVIKVIDSLGCADTDTFFLFVNDTLVADPGPDRVLCFNDTIFLVAGGLDTVANGNSGIYRWYNKTTVPTSFLGTNDHYEIVAQNDVEYELKLQVTQGGITCHDSDNILIYVNPLPVISLRPDKDICCDYGNVSLNFDVNSPAGGTWSSTDYPFLVNNNIFYTDSACGIINAPARSVTSDVVYTYQDPATLCINSDSIKIKVNALPRLILNEGDYCQDINEIKLDDDIVISPANTSLGSPSWSCIECNGNDFSKMLVDKGFVGAPDFWLDISESTYSIQNPGKDTIILEFEYVNEFGCRNRDTTSIRVWRVPKVEFSQLRDLCWDEGEVKLDDLTGVNLTDGVWSVYDSSGFRLASTLGGIVGDTINTLNSVQLPNPIPGVKSYIIRYTHTATGCPAFNDTTLTINPLPSLTLTDFTRQPPNYCETESNIPLTANPSGGSWSSTDPSALAGGNAFSPGSASTHSAPIWFYYDYTNPATGCRSIDSIDAVVEPSPTLNIPNDTSFCKPLGAMQTNLSFKISAEDNSSLSWFAANVYNNANRANLSTAPVFDGSFTHQNQSTDTFRILAFAGGLGSCNDIDDFFDIIVHPRPDASIAPSVPNGCNPVTTDFAVTLNNSVVPDPVNGYNWDLGNGDNSSSDVPNTTYTTDGTSNISLVFTSDKGCDTTLTTTVDVYPIPVADFVPNPDNYTTAALPRFTFKNQSSVSNVLGSSITNNYWDFGDPNASDDVSTDLDPSWFYSSDTNTYMVKLVVETNFGCKDSFEYPVIVGPDLIVYIPNAFTPDNAGPTDNEGFSAVISGELWAEIIVFNRWGEIMYQTNEIIEDGAGKTKTQPWNGDYKGVPAQQDVYAYQLKVKALNQKEYTYTGTLTLIR